MPLLVPSVGENKLLAFALGKEAPSNQLLKLFVNDVTPGDTDVAETYTEMSTLGYASKTLTLASWTIAQATGVAEGSYAQQIWTFTSGTAVVIYGYFVVDSGSGVLLWAERFGTSKTVQTNGDQLLLTPKITLSKV